MAWFSDYYKYYTAVQNCILWQLRSTIDHTDWLKWRYCYQGGDDFRDEFLKEFVGTVGQEGTAAFSRRKDLTPIPAVAKTEINAIKNSVGRRLRDVQRSGGSDAWQDAVQGNGRGVDLRGSSMTTFFTKRILAELLVMGKVGVMVDAPKVAPAPGRNVTTRADIPPTFQPYLQTFIVEKMPILIPAPAESPSDWSNVLVESVRHEFNLDKGGVQKCTKTYRYYWLEEDDPARLGRVNTVVLDQNAQEITPVLQLDIDAIPFVLFEIDNSLMIDVCSYQIALLNMISADSSYAIDSNFTFLTRQRGATDIGEHLEGGDGNETTRIGSNVGLWYNKNMERPGFISPSSDPMKASLELRKEMKQEVRDIVQGALADLGEEGSVESGLAAIGDALLTGESRCWDHWTTFEESTPARRQVPTISYPHTWTLKTDEQRIAEAEQFMKLGNLVVGQRNKKQMARAAVVSLHSGTVSTDRMNELLAEVDASPLGIADPDVVIRGKKEGILSVETAAIALGANPDEGEKAKQDAADRAAMVVAAQSDVDAAGRGNPDSMADENSDDVAREGETEGATNLRETGNPGRPETNE